MKTTELKRIHCPAYPNAADRRITLPKLMDGVLSLVTGIGAVTALVFLIML